MRRICRGIQNLVNPSTWGRSESGLLGTIDHRVFVIRSGSRLSPWHDVPLYTSSGLVNFINEIPKGTRRKMEISKEELLNPIKQDLTKDGQLRMFQAGDIPFNYGALPQTWENPLWIHPDAQCGGDDDPIDAVEVSASPLKTGEIVTAKVLGVIGLIDQNEADWKVIVRRCAEGESDVMDASVSEEVIHVINRWFRTYKLSEGFQVENRLLFDGRLMPVQYAQDVIDQAHQHWKQMQSH